MKKSKCNPIDTLCAYNSVENFIPCRIDRLNWFKMDTSFLRWIVHTLRQRFDFRRIERCDFRNDDHVTSCMCVYRACAFVIGGFLSFGSYEEANGAPSSACAVHMGERFDRSSS